MNRYKRIFRCLISLEESGVFHILDLFHSELSFPNIPMPTMGGKVFWNNIAECNGWKLQQNMLTQHARILDKNNVRIAWGTLDGMIKALDRMVEYLHKYDEFDIK